VSGLRKSPLTIPVLVVLLGIAASIFSWKRVSEAESVADEKRLRQRASQVALRLRDAVELEAETLRVLAVSARDALQTSQPVHLGAHLPLPPSADDAPRALKWAAWCRPLAYAEVLQLEHAIGPPFHVRSVDGQRLLAPAGDDTQSANPFWVLEHVEPRTAAPDLEGLDLSGVAAWAHTLGESLGNARLGLCPPHPAGSPPGTVDGILVALPVSLQSGPGSRPAGLVVGELAVEPLLKRAFTRTAGDLDTVGAVVLDHGVLIGTAGPPAREGAEPAEASIDIGDRRWTIAVHPAEPAAPSYGGWLDRTSVVLPGAILVVMFLVSWVVWLQQQQTFLIRKQVARQTATLRRQNMELEDKERQLEETNRRLHEISNTDPLTGLLNRRGFEVQLDRERERSRRTGAPCGLLFFDVDHFKGFNDRYGHAAGDEVLRRVAQLMSGEARRIDCVARYGGEEFVVLASATDAAGLITLAERIRARVESAGIANEASPLDVVTVSGGGALFGGNMASDVRAVFDLADRCLYQAKSTGRNRVVMVS
jgi:diguanylate cyclase (GGDEF)-like protein